MASSTGPMLWANDKLRLVLTSQCNLSCFYCHNEGQRKGSDFFSPELFDQVVKAANTAKDFPKVVTFTGGEPLLNPYLEFYASRLRGLTERLTVVTNGLLLDRFRIESLLRSGITSVRIGIDSISKDKSRPTRALADTRKVIRAIDLLLENGVSPKLNVVLTNFNRDEIAIMLAFCAERQLSAKFFEQVEPSLAPVGALRFAPAPYPALKFPQFDRIVRSTFLSAVGNDCPIVGAANTVYQFAGFEIRYCRFLCAFEKCHVTGTRIDPKGRVYSCMNATNHARIRVGDSPHRTIGAIRRAVSQGCNIRDRAIAHVAETPCQPQNAQYI